MSEAASAAATNTSGTANKAAAIAAERDRKRQQLRDANLRIWESGPAVTHTGPLDSNLKKNTAFVKRVKQGLGADARDQLIKELGILNLDKYLEEILQVVPEGLSKCTAAKDSFAAIEILSAFHTRFGGPAFSKPVSVQLSAQLAQPSRASIQALSPEQKEREESMRIARQKGIIRVAADAALVECVRGDGQGSEGTPGLEWLYTTTRDMLTSDREHANVPILTVLLKAHGTVLLGPKSANVDEVSDTLQEVSLQEHGSAASERPVPVLQVPLEWQAKFRKLCAIYFGTLSKRISRDHLRLFEQDKRNHEAYIRSGEIFEDRQQNYEKMTKNLDKLIEAGKGLSELIDVPMPVLREAKEIALGGSVGVNLDATPNLQSTDAEERYASGMSPWEDEDTRKFYEDILDLKDVVPASVLALEKGASEPILDGWAKQKEALDASSRTDAEDKEQPLAAQGAHEEVIAIVENSPCLPSKDLDSSSQPQSPMLHADMPHDDVEEDSEGQITAGPAAQLNALLAKLPEMTNRAMIDSAAVDFVYLNNKLARRKLVRATSNVPRNRSDLIPYYARLIATLNRYMPDVGTLVTSTLDEEFRYFQRKRQADMHESRARNVRFLSELTKFKVTPIHIIFHCLKVCLDGFSGHNIDNLAGFLEGCGRFLLRTPETSDRMRSALELLRRKRAATNLDHRQVLILDNAYYQCNPPERKATQKRERSPMEQFINHLVFNVLSKKHLEKVLKLMRKLHWEDPAIIKHLHEVFTKMWKVKFSHIHLLVILLHDLQPYHSDFSIRVIDQICEDIRAGMEANIFKNNQRRVATVKFLGELYNYRMISSSIIFDQLWSFTTFGHRNGTPLPNQISPLDAPDDYFRVRLVCTLLDTCGMCFDRGSPKKRLDEFLVFFNFYLMSKQQPLPMDVDFMLSDLLESLRPNFELKKTFEEAAQAVQEMERAKGVPSAQQEAEESDDESSDDDDDDDDVGQRGNRARSSGATTPIDGADSDADTEIDNAVDEPHIEDESMIMRGERERQMLQEQDEEFARELAKMMAESSSVPPGGATRSQKGLFDAAIPLLKRSSASVAESVDQTEAVAKDGQHMKFSLLSKRGNRVLTHDVDVPIDAAIAVNTRTKQMRDAAERQQLKQLVLSYEGREQERQDESLMHEFKNRGFKVKVVKDRNAG